jgi:FAD/FMN-containing dehydrogenase
VQDAGEGAQAVRRPSALPEPLGEALPEPLVEALPEPLVEALAGCGVPVVTDRDILAGHSVDWTGRWAGPVLGLVRPRTTEQVAHVLAVAREHRVPVQVQGGNTGLVGGSVPVIPALLLSTVGLDRVEPVDARERTVLVGAGVTLGRLSAHAASAGLRFGVDLAARDSATVGGMAATNAGGLGVVAHGMMRDNIRGLTAVLADGRIVRTIGRPRKDNTGYDLTNLLVGSEGTLGVITEVEVELHVPPAASTVGLLAIPTLAEAVRLARQVQSAGWPLLAAEVVDAQGVSHAVGRLGLPDPMPPGAAWLLLLEVADGATGAGLQEVGDHVHAVGTDPAQRARLWAYRERQTELYAGLPDPGPRKVDVSLRLDRLDEAVAEIHRAVAAAPDPGSPGPPWAGVFGHALDGNLHVQLVDAAPGAVARVLAQVTALGGSISAEHGIGRLKAPHLALVRSADEIAWMRQVRATVDPDGMLNTGVLLEG